MRLFTVVLLVMDVGCNAREITVFKANMVFSFRLCYLSFIPRLLSAPVFVFGFFLGGGDVFLVTVLRVTL